LPLTSAMKACAWLTPERFDCKLISHVACCELFIFGKLFRWLSAVNFGWFRHILTISLVVTSTGVLSVERFSFALFLSVKTNVFIPPFLTGPCLLHSMNLSFLVRCRFHTWCFHIHSHTTSRSFLDVLLCNLLHVCSLWWLF
jgi:hypothetical protein